MKAIILETMKIPKPLIDLIDSFQKLPGIGTKTAQRLSYYLLHVPQSELDEFSEALANLKKNTVLCKICKNVSEEDPCWICSDTSRDASLIMVVEQPLDVLAFERSGKYKGTYHILHGSINPLDNIGPEEIFIKELMDRVIGINGDDREGGEVKEIIIATNPTMEGDATAMYIAGKLKDIRTKELKNIKITRLGMGIPTGADLEYADDVTLGQAYDGRREM